MFFFGFLAYTIMIFHIIFIGFVIGLIPLTLIGQWMGWPWITNPFIRYTHLFIQIGVGIESIFAWPCPFTWLENRFRELAGKDPYTTGFIDFWSQKLFSVPINPLAFNTVSFIIFASSLYLFISIPPANSENINNQLKSIVAKFAWF